MVPNHHAPWPVSQLEPGAVRSCSPRKHHARSGSRSWLSQQLTLPGPSNPLPLSLTQSLSFLSFFLALSAPSPSGCGIQRPGSGTLPQALCRSAPGSHPLDQTRSYPGESALYHTFCDSGYKFDKEGVGGTYWELQGIKKILQLIFKKYDPTANIYLVSIYYGMQIFTTQSRDLRKLTQLPKLTSALPVALLPCPTTPPPFLLLPLEVFKRKSQISYHFTLAKFSNSLITFLRIFPLLVSHVFSHEAFTLCWVGYCIFIWSWS